MDFQKTKEQFKVLFHDIIDVCEKLYQTNNGIDRENAKLKEFLDNNTNYDFEDICKNLKISLEMIARNCMKCVIFGKTSNGKSAILNALLKQVVVPSSKGRTTSCFISVQGCDEDEGYIMDGNERKDIKIIEKASEFSKEKYAIDKLIQVFWPRSRCEILRKDVEIFDSPGVDYSKGNDKCIDKYCQDADVFILAVDGCSTLNESEKSFFVRLKELVSIPDIFVLVNKWDLVKADPSMEIDKIKSQHNKEIQRFLTVDLNHYNDEQISERIFFISALNNLQRKGDSEEIDQFENFREAFELDLSTNAIRTKFKRHFDKGMDVAEKIYLYSSVFPAFIHKNPSFSPDKMKDNFQRQCENAVFKEYGDITRESKRHMELESSRLSSYIKKAIEKRSTFIEQPIKFIEETLMESVCYVYRSKIEKLREELRKIFIENSCIVMTKTQMDEYFQKHLMFAEVIEEYETDIKKFFKNTSMDIKNIFQEQSDSNETMKKIRETLNKGGPILVAAAVALSKMHPTTAAVMTTIGVAAQGVDQVLGQKERKSPLEEDIKKELTDYFNTIIETALQKTFGKVVDMVNKLVPKHVGEQMNMLNLCERFEDFRLKSEGIMSQFKEIQNSHSGIF